MIGALAFGAASAAAQAPPQTIALPGTVRDFTDAHPDFEGVEATDRGIVQSQLGPDKKPVYAPAGASITTSGAASFNQWYRPVPGVNAEKPLTLEAQLVPGSSPPTYRFASAPFFPIDGELLGNQGRAHNFHFTFEFHGRFTYTGGEVFTFEGDDDVWVFLNNQLVIDLGGVHETQVAAVGLDAIAPSIGLQRGNTYDFDLFFAERRTFESSFQLETSLAIEPDGATPGAPPLRGTGAGSGAGAQTDAASLFGQPEDAVCAPVSTRRTSKKGTITFNKAAMVTQQRIDAAALRRLNAANDWMDAGIVPTDLCGNGFAALAFQAGMSWTQGPSGSDAAPPRPRPLKIVKKSKLPANFTADVRQARINDKISIALEARSKATAERLASLTGGNLARSATLGSRPRKLDLVGGSPVPASDEPRATRLRIGPLATQGRITATAAQLRRTQRRSQEAVLLANAINDRIKAGLTEDQFTPGSIGSSRST